jgi:hypothetical protein
LPTIPPPASRDELVVAEHQYRGLLEFLVQLGVMER